MDSAVDRTAVRDCETKSPLAARGSSAQAPPRQVRLPWPLVESARPATLVACVRVLRRPFVNFARLFSWSAVAYLSSSTALWARAVSPFVAIVVFVMRVALIAGTGAAGFPMHGVYSSLSAAR